jgi:hypothetical protein
MCVHQQPREHYQSTSELVPWFAVKSLRKIKQMKPFDLVVGVYYPSDFFGPNHRNLDPLTLAYLSFTSALNGSFPGFVFFRERAQRLRRGKQHRVDYTVIREEAPLPRCSGRYRCRRQSVRYSRIKLPWPRLPWSVIPCIW